MMYSHTYVLRAKTHRNLIWICLEWIFFSFAAVVRRGNKFLTVDKIFIHEFRSFFDFWNLYFFIKNAQFFFIIIFLLLTTMIKSKNPEINLQQTFIVSLFFRIYELNKKPPGRTHLHHHMPCSSDVCACSTK